MEAMRVASFAGSSPPSLGRERATVGVDVESLSLSLSLDPERPSPRYHETLVSLPGLVFAPDFHVLPRPLGRRCDVGKGER